jgi:hypothetical protein
MTNKQKADANIKAFSTLIYFEERGVSKYNGIRGLRDRLHAGFLTEKQVESWANCNYVEEAKKYEMPVL